MAKLNWEKLAKQQRADKSGTQTSSRSLKPVGAPHWVHNDAGIQSGVILPWQQSKRKYNKSKPEISRATRNKALEMIRANKNKNLTQ